MATTLNLYAKPMYKMRLRDRVKWWFRRAKYVRQRARWGFSEYDIQDLDSYLAELIGNMTDYLAKHNKSHPTEISDEDWKIILITISKCFKQYNIEKPCPSYEAYHNAATFTINPDNSITVEAPDHLLNAWKKEERANHEATMAELRQGFDLLYQHYPYLWD